MFMAQTVGMAETYCEHAGPKTVESMTSEELSRCCGEVQRREPTGGWKKEWIENQFLVCDTGIFLTNLCIWDILEVSDVRVRIIETTNESTSSSVNSQISLLSLRPGDAGNCERCHNSLEHCGTWKIGMTEWEYRREEDSAIYILCRGPSKEHHENRR